MTTPSATQVGTAGGTFLSIVPNVYSEDVLRTVVLAIVGAVVSFVVSVLLRCLMKKRKR